MSVLCTFLVVRHHVLVLYPNYFRVFGGCYCRCFGAEIANPRRLTYAAMVAANRILTKISIANPKRWLPGWVALTVTLNEGSYVAVLNSPHFNDPHARTIYVDKIDRGMHNARQRMKHGGKQQQFGLVIRIGIECPTDFDSDFLPISQIGGKSPNNRPILIPISYQFWD